jgi:hypothetical protein
MKHSTTHKLTALAAGISFAFIAGSASAFNLGEVWVGVISTSRIRLL